MLEGSRASNDRFMSPVSTSAALNAPDVDAPALTYTFTIEESSTSTAFRLRVKGTGSLYARVDRGSWSSWSASATVWTWKEMQLPESSKGLSIGRHCLQVLWKTGSLRIDALELELNPDQSGGGGTGGGDGFDITCSNSRNEKVNISGIGKRRCKKLLLSGKELWCKRTIKNSGGALVESVCQNECLDECQN